MQLEHLNHLLAIVTVSSFVYSRTQLSKDLTEADALPQQNAKITESVNELIEKIRTQIRKEISEATSTVRLIIKGVTNKEVFDFENNYKKKLWTKLLDKVNGRLELFNSDMKKIF